MLNEFIFWDIISKSCIYDVASYDEDASFEQAEKVVDLLKSHSPDEIIKFDEILLEKRKEAYRWDLWAMAYIVNAGCSDDGFEYFRAWLIGLGKNIFEQALEKPESIIQYTNPDFDAYENEQLLYAGSKAYESLTGKEMPSIKGYKNLEPRGIAWKEHELPELFPNACKKYGLEI